MNPVRYGTSLNTSKPHVLHWKDYLRHFGHPIESSFHLWPNNPCLEKDYIEKSLGEGCQIVASNYYPPCPEPHRTFGLSAHSDHGGLTILMQNDVDGLRVRYNDTWIPVHHVPGTLVVNIGDYLELWSMRKRLAVGHGPDLNSIIALACALVDQKDEPPLYKPIVYRDYMRCQQSCAVRGKEPLGIVKTNASATSSSSLEISYPSESASLKISSPQ
ncbi:hypothetical protein MKX01_037400 [Papaver californicum]|nr:hypothetical protein MKX01_037400 [Papaver californicum]